MLEKLREGAKAALIELGWKTMPYSWKRTNGAALLTPEVLAPYASVLLGTLRAGDRFSSTRFQTLHTYATDSISLALLWQLPGADLMSWSRELVHMLLATKDRHVLYSYDTVDECASFANAKLREMPESALAQHTVELIAALEACTTARATWDPPHYTSKVMDFVSNQLPASSLRQHIPALIRCKAVGALSRLPLDAIKPYVPEMIRDRAFPVLKNLPADVLAEHIALWLPELFAAPASVTSGFLQTIGRNLSPQIFQPHAQLLVKQCTQETADGQAHRSITKSRFNDHRSYDALELLGQLDWQAFASQLAPVLLRTHLEESSEYISHGSSTTASKMLEEVGSDTVAAQASLIVAYLFTYQSLRQACDEGLDVTSYKQVSWIWNDQYVTNKEWAARTNRAAKLLSRLPAESLQVHAGALVWLLADLQGNVQGVVARHVKALSPESLAADPVVLHFARSRLIASSTKKTKEYGLRLLLTLVEKIPQALNLRGLDESAPWEESAGGSSVGSGGSGCSGATLAEKVRSEAIAAAQGLLETHDVAKLSERLVKAIERANKCNGASDSKELTPKKGSKEAAELLRKKDLELEQWRSGALRFAPEIIDVDEGSVSAGTVVHTDPPPRAGSKRPLEQTTSGSSGTATVITVKCEQANLEATANNAEEDLNEQSTVSTTAAVSLSEASFSTGRDEAESTVGGTMTCIVCMVGQKSHLAVPCGHQCVCEGCAAQMDECPICRMRVATWIKVHMA